MTGSISFALLREGTSDDGLITHLRDLILRAGAREALGTSRPFRGSCEEKLRLFAAEGSNGVDIVFLHRDADRAGYEARKQEIDQASESCGLSLPVVPLIPVQELEAWLIVDEAAIREVVGKPQGRIDLNLPKLKHVEGTSRPKELLEAACIIASEATGRRLLREKRQFNERRRALLERLDPDGPVRNLEAWVTLRDLVEFHVSRLANTYS